MAWRSGIWASPDLGSIGVGVWATVAFEEIPTAWHGHLYSVIYHVNFLFFNSLSCTYYDVMILLDAPLPPWLLFFPRYQTSLISYHTRFIEIYQILYHIKSLQRRVY